MCDEQPGDTWVVRDLSDSPELRTMFSDSAKDIADGWHIIAQGDDGDYGYDLWMLLKGPDGKYYEQTAGCCSCYGIEDQWGPVETNLDAIKATYEAEERLGLYSCREKVRAMAEACTYLKNEIAKGMCHEG